jgi:hypothetical protein
MPQQRATTRDRLCLVREPLLRVLPDKKIISYQLVETRVIIGWFQPLHRRGGFPPSSRCDFAVP